HTRSYGDWSSDVCSSDLKRVSRLVGRDVVQRLALRVAKRVYLAAILIPLGEGDAGGRRIVRAGAPPDAVVVLADALRDGDLRARSEERRVGEEGRCRVAR